MALGDMLKACGAVKFGKFILTSGKESSFYVDIKKASTNPMILKEVSKEIAKYVPGYSKIAGMELGAVPIAVGAALETNVPYVIVRKEKREHGTGKQIEGDLQAGEKVLIVEDVATTGGSSLKTVEYLKAAGAIVDKVIVVVDREEGAKDALKAIGIELVPLVRISQIMDKK
ncbi:MAG: orotate phosphoribosyltransferase [Candidatus Thermoplasmatota archaeon]|nr:orotate phosphoribosyltransferase [Candidatus Thermoplasmatota archaeon]